MTILPPWASGATTIIGSAASLKEYQSAHQSNREDAPKGGFRGDRGAVMQSSYTGIEIPLMRFRDHARGRRTAGRVGGSELLAHEVRADPAGGARSVRPEVVAGFSGWLYALPSWARAITSEVTAGINKYRIEYTTDTTTTVRDALNRTEVVTFDKTKGKNVVAAVTGPYLNQPPKTKYKMYDYNLNLRSEKDQLEYQTFYNYDSDGNVTSIITPSKTTGLTSELLTCPKKFNNFGLL